MKKQSTHTGLRTMALALTLAIISLGVVLPIFYESQSLHYKFGVEKAMLQWGKAAGFMALILMVYQVVLVSRFSFLEKYIPLRRLFSLHKTVAVLICALVVIHPVLILGADGFGFFPFELRYWAEFLGIILLALILFTVGLSWWRNALHIKVRAWQRLHRLATPAIVALALIHARTVSETFDLSPPGIWLGGVAFIVLALFARIYFNRFAKK